MSLVLIECKILPREDRRKLLQQVIPQPCCKSSLLDFLMLEAWEARGVDCSKVQLKTLLVDKRVTKPEVIQRFVNSGVPVREEDLSCAIQTLPADDVVTFKLIASKCANFDESKLCEEAVSCNKTPFVVYFVERGAKLPGDSARLFSEALKANDFDGATFLVKSFTSDMIKQLDLGVLLKTTNLVTSTELMKLLLKMGISYTVKTSPVVAVMNRTLNLREQIEAISMLIEGGVDCKQLCLTSPKSTTPLHVATELALKSGKHWHVHWNLSIVDTLELSQIGRFPHC